MRATEIETLQEFDRRTTGPDAVDSIAGWMLQDLDLRDREDVLAGLDPTGAVFLGCSLSSVAQESLRRRGALLFPRVPDVPFDPYRAGLYTPEELYAELDRGYQHTPDARIYAWAQRAVRPHPAGADVHENLAMALHDSAIDDALAEYVRGRRVVGVMGGHQLRRDEATYADAARLGAALAEAGLTVATGGGPGAMEAANLGAAVGAGALDRVLATVARVPDYRPSVTAWAEAGFAALAEPAERSGQSLGVPTWFYGHEPPNPFCAAVAKYFRNAIREDVLLHLCREGVVFLPGAAGTVQEVFQAACENYYAEATSVAPMVLVGRHYWTRTLPVWPLLETLAGSRAMAGRLALVDTPDEVAGVLARGLS